MGERGGGVGRMRGRKAGFLFLGIISKKLKSLSANIVVCYLVQIFINPLQIQTARN